MKVLCFEIEYVGFGKSWKRLAKEGQKIKAIQELRKLEKKKKLTLSLAREKAEVEAYMEKHNYKVVW